MLLTWASLALSAKVLLLPVWRSIRHGLRRELAKKGLCIECGYDLTGNASGRCPECGARTPPPGMVPCVRCKSDCPYDAARCSNCAQNLPRELSPSQEKTLAAGAREIFRKGNVLRAAGLVAACAIIAGLSASGISYVAGVPISAVPTWIWLMVPISCMAGYAGYRFIRWLIANLRARK